MGRANNAATLSARRRELKTNMSIYIYIDIHISIHIYYTYTQMFMLKTSTDFMVKHSISTFIHMLGIRDQYWYVFRPGQ